MEVTLYNVLFRSHWNADVILQVVAVAERLPSNIMETLISAGEKVESHTYDSLNSALEEYENIICHKMKDVEFHMFVLEETDNCDVFVEWVESENGDKGDDE